MASKSTAMQSPSTTCTAENVLRVYSYISLTMSQVVSCAEMRQPITTQNRSKAHLWPARTPCTAARICSSREQTENAPPANLAQQFTSAIGRDIPAMCGVCVRFKPRPLVYSQLTHVCGCGRVCTSLHVYMTVPWPIQI